MAGGVVDRAQFGPRLGGRIKKGVEVPKKKKDKLKLVAYCGLYCDLCAERNRMPYQAAALRQTMTKGGWHQLGKTVPGFKDFWKFLAGLARPDGACLGCRAGGGPPSPFCKIRECARKRKVEVCPFCSDFPCRLIGRLAQSYVTLIADGKRMKKLGLDAWVAEQKKRAKTGFCYVDIRCSPYSVTGELY